MASMVYICTPMCRTRRDRQSRPRCHAVWRRVSQAGAVVAAARAQGEIENQRRELLPRIAEGGFGQAVCRIVLAGMVSIGSFERRSFRLARLLSELQATEGASHSVAIDWTRVLRDEARLAAVAPVEALNALADMLPDTASRERALAVAAAVMMIEPTLEYKDVIAQHILPLHTKLVELLARHVGAREVDDALHQLAFALAAMVHDYGMSREFMNVLAPSLSVSYTHLTLPTSDLV